jgi:hypothetical protein
VRDPHAYREFGGGSLLPESWHAQFGAHKHASVRAAEQAAGVQDPPPAGKNAYGQPLIAGVSYKFVIKPLSYVNALVGQLFGVILLDPRFTPEFVAYAANHWPLDVSQAREALGWEATPWRVLAKRFGDAALAGKKGV